MRLRKTLRYDGGCGAEKKAKRNFSAVSDYERRFTLADFTAKEKGSFSKRTFQERGVENKLSEETALTVTDKRRMSFG